MTFEKNNFGNNGRVEPAVAALDKTASASPISMVSQSSPPHQRIFLPHYRLLHYLLRRADAGGDDAGDQEEAGEHHAHHPPPSRRHLLLHRLAAGDSEGVDSGGGGHADEEDWTGTPRVRGRHQLSCEGELLQVDLSPLRQIQRHNCSPQLPLLQM